MRLRAELAVQRLELGKRALPPLIGNLACGENTSQHRVDEEGQQSRQNDRGKNQNGGENSELRLVSLAHREPSALRGLDVADQLPRLGHEYLTMIRTDGRGRRVQTLCIVRAFRTFELRELFGDDRGECVEPALLGGVGDQSACGGERPMHIRGGAGSRIEIITRAGEDISALRRFGVGEPCEHGVQRLGDVSGSRDGIRAAPRCESARSEKIPMPSVTSAGATVAATRRVRRVVTWERRALRKRALDVACTRRFRTLLESEKKLVERFRDSDRARDGDT